MIVVITFKLPVANQPVYFGGPVHTERGLILHSADMKFESTMAVTDTVCLTTSADILEAMAENKGPAETLVALGCASWAPEQLETEIKENVWLTGPGNDDILFGLNPEDRWLRAAAALGVNLHLMSSQTGHA